MVISVEPSTLDVAVTKALIVEMIKRICSFKCINLADNIHEQMTLNFSKWVKLIQL